jgi:hypothetical protein
MGQTLETTPYRLPIRVKRGNRISVYFDVLDDEEENPAPGFEDMVFVLTVIDRSTQKTILTFEAGNGIVKDDETGRVYLSKTGAQTELPPKEYYYTITDTNAANVLTYFDGPFEIIK